MSSRIAVALTIVLGLAFLGALRRFPVQAQDVKFDVGTINAEAGELEVTLLEKGKQQHTFVIRGHEGKLAVTPSDETDSGSFELEPGEYEYYCDVPGHEAQGMKGTLVVK